MVLDDIWDKVVDLIMDYYRYAVDYAYSLYTSAWDYASWVYDAAKDYADSASRAVKDYAEELLNDLSAEVFDIWDYLGELEIPDLATVLGWVDPLVEDAKDFAEGLVSNAVDTINQTLGGVLESISSLRSWIDGAPEWLISTLYTLHGSVSAYLADYAEEVLDLIFREGED